MIEQQEENGLFAIPGQQSFFAEGASEYDEKTTRPSLSLGEVSHVCILICDILNHFDRTLPEPWLYDIMVVSGYVSYFLYADALGFLLEQGSLKYDEKREEYQLTEQGVTCAKTLRRYVPKLFRDRVILTALRYVARSRALRDLNISYEQQESGCVICIQCTDRGKEMLSLRIHAANEEEARELGECVLRNPAGIFGKILDLVLNNEEEQYDLSAN